MRWSDLREGDVLVHPREERERLPGLVYVLLEDANPRPGGRVRVRALCLSVGKVHVYVWHRHDRVPDGVEVWRA